MKGKIVSTVEGDDRATTVLCYGKGWPLVWAHFWIWAWILSWRESQLTPIVTQSHGLLATAVPRLATKWMNAQVLTA